MDDGLDLENMDYIPRGWFDLLSKARPLWSAPDTRKRLLEGLAEKGFGKDQLAEMQKIIDAEKSDLFDVLAHVAYALAPITRANHASTASSKPSSTSCSRTTWPWAWTS
jgi:type I restriction enzyme R subunit